MASTLNILIAASEVYPFAKTGGLADVCGALPKALARSGHQTRVILPLYRDIIQSQIQLRELPETISVPIGHRQVVGKLFAGELSPDVPALFIEQNDYFDRDHLYGPPSDGYADNAERFIFFSRAILETCKALKIKPDILHCNDWQTGLVPVFLKTFYAYSSIFRKTRTIFSIHNLGYQGQFPKSDVLLANLPLELFNPKGIEFFGDFNFLKSGVVFADLITTVSKTYSQEILKPENAFRMEASLNSRARDLFGIVNGIDTDDWNPATDRWIKQRFDVNSVAGKSVCRQDLIEQFKLDLSDETPLVCLVTRLTPQKGIDLILDGLNFILENAGLIVTGIGDAQYEVLFRSLKGKRLGVFLKFDEAIAHKVIAGSDILLMPSVYEPCGLTQMAAMRYGTVPLVSAVGGLEDTVTPFSPDTLKGLGFKFFPYGLESFKKEFSRALPVFRDKSKWSQLRANCLSADFSWDNAAEEYIRVYRKALGQ